MRYPVKNGDEEKKIFQNAIKKKMEKLASYRNQGYQKVGLFVFYDEPPIPVKLEDLKDYFDEAMNGYNDKYDIIYFVHSFEVLAYDVLTGEALRFLYQEGIVIIPKSVHVERMEENLAIFDFELAADELNEIEKLKVGRSLFGWW